MENKTEKDNLRLLDSSYRKDINCIKIGANNTESHELAKSRICIYLKKNLRKFITEAHFNDGSRADVFDITESVCYEVVHSEKAESIELKKTKYPVYLVALSSQEVLDCDFEGLSKYLN